MAAAAAPAASVKDKLKAVQKQIEALVISEDKPIRVNSFWNKFTLFHQIRSTDLPVPREYGLTKRSEFLKLSQKCLIYKGNDGQEYIRSNVAQTKKEKKKGQKGEKEGQLETQLQTTSPETSLTSSQTADDMSYRNPFYEDPNSWGRYDTAGPSGYQQQHFQQHHPNQHYQNQPYQHQQQQRYQHQQQSRRYQYEPQEGYGGSQRHKANVKHIPKEQVNTVALDCIDRLVEAKEYVSPERIEKLLKDHYQVESLQDIGIRHLEHIKCINDHMRSQARVNGYIQAFIRVRAIATLYELHENLREYVEDKQDFEKLRLGPLTKQPLVYDYFKFPADEDIPEIDTSTILDHLRNYLTENNLWGSRVEMEGFMGYLTTQLQVDSPFTLGIKIKSLPLAAGILKKSQRDVSQANAAAVRTFSGNMSESVSAAFRNFSSGVLVEEAGLCSVRRDLLTKSSTKVVEQVFSKLNVMLSSLTYLGPDLRTGKSKPTAKACELTKQLSNLLKNNELYRGLFQMAVCCSWEEVHGSLQSLIGYGEEPQGDGQGQAAGQGPSGGGQQQRPRPRIGDIVQKLMSYLERCFVHGSLTLSHLARIENKLLEEFDFATFHLLTNLTFLDLVTGNDDIKRYLDENGGAVLGSAASGSAQSGAGYQAALVDLHDFILQAALTETSQLPELERALCWHYQVAEVKLLGHGSVSSLQTGAVRAHRHPKQHHVTFETALCAKDSQSSLGTSRSVGLLGHQVRESALLCLNTCPVLGDMAEWSHWDLIYKPELGELKDFVRKNGGVHSFVVPGTNKTVITKLVAMETKPGTLLKLTMDTSNDMFASAAVAGDVSATCGHLVSLVAVNKGIQNTPLALLGNHLKTSLLKIQAATQIDPEAVTGNDAGSLAAGRFVLQCLTSLPFVTCQAVASQVFVEPLSDVVGQTKSRELLPLCTTTDAERSRLQALGLLLGIDQWSATFQQRLEPPTVFSKTAVSGMSGGMAAQVVPQLIELSSSEDEDESEESDFLNTSDESDDEETPAQPNLPDVIQISSQEEAMETEAESKPSLIDLTEEEDKPETGDRTDTSSPSVEPDLDDMTRPCWEVVEDIRRTEFGINVTLSNEGEKLMKKQQERLGRSLDRLSTDLYSKDTHFVLELIQNADDNHYPAENGSVPSIKFIVEPDKISVLNNEQGFEEKNIRAICDVGKSTKGKHKAGYIGQKGIGFKSVFRVTDCPVIHSNGYHFKFDLSTGPMGYILPHWVKAHHDQSERWMTRIVLPLKEDVVQSSKLRQLAARFQDVHPSLLLFLHRLRSITVINKIGDYKAKMERRDVGNSIVEIRHMTGSDRQTTKTDRWLVVKKTLDASHISSQAKSGVEVESTEIALAFPLHEVDDSQTLAPKQPVFAFLPLRSYGFRFIIQGDFDVPSSREDVDRDSMWNQWLQSEINSLFVAALKAFKEQRNFSMVEAVCLFIKFIPLEDEILDFFRPVASQILQRLRSEPCLPADAPTGQVPAWCLPSQLILSTDTLLQDIVTPQLLQSQLGLSYLHREVAARVNPSLLSGLGVQVVTTAHLVQIGRALTHQLPDVAQQEKPQWIQRIAKWFAAVFRSVDELNVDKNVLEQIQALHIVPLSNGDVTCLKDNAVFFPLGAEETEEAESNQDMLQYLEKDLNTVDSALFIQLDEAARPQAWRLLEMLGVRRLQPADIIHHHILPALKAPHIMAKPQGLLTAYFVYIKEELDRQPNLVSLDELREVAIILTNHGLKRPNKEPVHFPPVYGNQLTLKEQLPGYDWVLVDPVYLARTETSLGVQSWHNFLAALGVYDNIAMKEEHVKVTRQDIDQSLWSRHVHCLPPTENDFELIDCDCPQFMALVTENSHQQDYHRQMQVLFDIIDSYWETRFASCTTTKLKTASGQVLKEVETTFGMMLRELGWLPSVQVVRSFHPSGRAVATNKQSEHKGSDLFLQTMMTERLLDHHVPYLHTFKQPRNTLCEFLGVRTTLTPHLLIELLVTWSVRKAIGTPSELLTSLAHIKAVYTFLHEQLPPKDLQDLFHSHPVIFVPQVDTSQLQDPQIPIEGKMMSRQEVRWTDPIGLYSKYLQILLDQGQTDLVKPSLKTWYRDQEDLMLRSARVAAKPTLTEYCDLIITLANRFPVHQVLSDVLQLFSLIGAELESHMPVGPLDQVVPFEVQKALSKLKPTAVFPTKGNKWVTLSDHPLIPDDKQTERLFSKKEGVHIIASEDKAQAFKQRTRGMGRRGPTVAYDPNQVLAFYEACGMETISSVLTSKYVTESFQVCPSVHRYIASVLPYIQNLLCMEFPEVYEELRNIRDRLANIKFVQVARLEVVYHLKPLPDVVVYLSELCKLKDDEDEFTFYIHKDSTANLHDINKELAHYFSRGDDGCMKEIKSVLIDIMPLVRDASPALQELMRNRDIEKLPDGEEPWQLPPPPVIQPPPPPPPKPTPPLPRPETPQQGGSRPPTPTGEGLMSWPPRSNPEAADRPRAPGGSRPPGSTMWPPPAPPSRPDHSQVPQGLRPARSNLPARDGQDTADRASHSGDSTSGHPSVSGQHSSERPASGQGSATGRSSPTGSIGQHSTTGHGSTSGSHPTGGSRSGLGGSSGHQGSGLGQRADTEESTSLRGDGSRGPAPSQSESRTEGSESESGEDGGSVEKMETDVTATPNQAHPAGGDGNATFKTPSTPGTPRAGQKRVRLESGASVGSVSDREHLWFDMPAWADQAVEEEGLEDIQCGLSKLPTDLTLEESSGEVMVGRWGEQLVYNYLLSLKDNPDSQVFFVKWVNEVRESALPYDCEVHYYDSETETTRQVFVEVKATRSDKKAFFPISGAEVKCAYGKEENYHLYRVFNAGNAHTVRLTKMENLAAKIDTKVVRLCLVI